PPGERGAGRCPAHAAAAGFIGTAMERIDFYIHATAPAVLFGRASSLGDAVLGDAVLGDAAPRWRRPRRRPARPGRCPLPPSDPRHRLRALRATGPAAGLSWTRWSGPPPAADEPSAAPQPAAPRSTGAVQGGRPAAWNPPGSHPPCSPPAGSPAGPPRPSARPGLRPDPAGAAHRRGANGRTNHREQPPAARRTGRDAGRKGTGRTAPPARPAAPGACRKSREP